MQRLKKISVVGAGAVGTIFGGLLKYHNPDVELVLIARGEHYECMREYGRAVLHGFWGRYEVVVNASTQPEDVTDSDLVLFTVKSQDTAETAREFTDLLGDAIVISLQNGINQHVLSQYFRKDRLLVGMTAANMALVEPGVVRLQRNGISVIGPSTPDVPADVVRTAGEALALSGLKVETSSQVLGVQYNKLLMNTMGYASVLSASDFISEGILHRPWRQCVALPLLSEGLAVLESCGIQLQRTSGISDVIRFRRLLHALNTPFADISIRQVLTKLIRPQRIVYSLYQDLMRGKPTEIDFINGEIVRLSQALGVASPYNAKVVEMVRRLEQPASKQFPSREDVLLQFRELRNP